MAEVRRDPHKTDAEKSPRDYACNLERVMVWPFGLCHDSLERSVKSSPAFTPKGDCPHTAGQVGELPLRFHNYPGKSVSVQVSYKLPTRRVGLAVHRDANRERQILLDKDRTNFYFL